MESSRGVLLVLIALAIIHNFILFKLKTKKCTAYCGQCLPCMLIGFISLDCGLPTSEHYPYTETAHGLKFYPDTTYIKSGKEGRVQEIFERFSKPYETLRYFPDGKRNCYSLSVEKGRKYLIRATFLYGNYDGHDISPVFDLYLGPNMWSTIDLNTRVNGTTREILHVPASNSSQICLVKTGPTTPIISTLELRPMRNDIYITKSGSLKLFYRRYFSKSGSTLQYMKDDVYDRMWVPFFIKEWTQISTSLEVGNSNIYVPPKTALATAATPTNTSAPLTIEWSSENPDDQYYYYAHFAEIQNLQANETREFNVLCNGAKVAGPFTPLKLAIITIYAKSPITCNGGECVFQLIRTNNSTLAPLLNAFEVYTVIHFPQSETDESDVVAIKDIASTYALSRINWQGDPCVPQEFRWDGLNCRNTDNSTPPRITTLNLSSSVLTGTIAAAIQNLTHLETLDLSNNNLTGEVPEFLSNMKSLSVINLSWNNLYGSLPQAFLRKGLNLSVEGNPRLCLSDSCRKQPKKKFHVAIVASASIAAIVITVLILFLVIKNKKSTMIIEDLHLLRRTSTTNDTFDNNNSRKFTYSEVIEVTNNFQKVLGRGGFGMVYHGTVNGYEQVAVKVLSQSSTQGDKQFKAEVDLLLRVHHTNLVSLVGYCYEGHNLALIYEFMPNGDLKQHLSGKGGISIVNWHTRLRIALEAAQGLEYIHIGCIPPMVHRDVKTANILLDENFKAKIADFGLSRSFQGGRESQETTAVAGTLGYLDPEYNSSGRLSEKSDVYSFGIVLLEMITNQPVINQTSNNSHITQWIGLKLNQGDIMEIMDPNLRGNFDSNSAWRALELAISCANPSSSKRPSMSQVINELKECILCENSGLSNNQVLKSQEMNITLDTWNVPVAR